MVRLLAAKASLITRHWPAHLVRLGHALNTAWPLSRALITSAAATVTGRPHLKEAGQIWREIWARRREWQYGYASSQTPNSKPAVFAPSA